MNNSKFILCPRGEGLSSIRLFEAMALGRVPVVIADNAKLPLESLIDYDLLVVRIPENDLNSLESVLLDFDKAHDLEEISAWLVEISKNYFKSKSLRNFLVKALTTEGFSQKVEN